MEKEFEKEVLDFKQKMESAGLSKYLEDIIYVPIMPMNGTEKQFLITEFYGVKIGNLISPDND